MKLKGNPLVVQILLILVIGGIVVFTCIGFADLCDLLLEAVVRTLKHLSHFF